MSGVDGQNQSARDDARGRSQHVRLSLDRQLDSDFFSTNWSFSHEIFFRVELIGQKTN